MAIKFVTDNDGQRLIEVVDSVSGVSFGGADYFKGNKFYAPANIASMLVSCNKCAYVEAKAETDTDAEAAKAKADAEANKGKK